MTDQTDERIPTVLANLKSRGVTLALDDFGTGYSSLSYLSEMLSDKLKVDRSFVTKSMKSSHARELLRGVISLGHGLGLKVQAEGEKEIAEVDVLRDSNLDYVQGYVFSRPIPAAADLDTSEDASSENTGDAEIAA